ncbi:YifB family Mg chelatase-like AAA ATPase [Halothiobacillus sp. DCM-1]|uniref:YifB family Mg chelatase-like AAA ATPase n=1 Tax=Halothiobacillus sp. DCM-1 TaxID=3112558 RepID=UPI0032538592
MTIAKVFSRAQAGIDAPLITVEAHVANGLPSITLVGLPETVVRESRDRVRAAILSSGFEFPPRRLTINLAPADLPKEGARFDLPIALAILLVTGQIPGDPAEQAHRLAAMECVGELSLDGGVCGVRGALSAALGAQSAGRALFVPPANAEEATVVRGVQAAAVPHLRALVAHVAGQRALPWLTAVTPPAVDPAAGIDLADVRGQPRAKRALALVAAGAHNLLLIGPPGAGKSMLAQRLPGILPPMTEAEAMESARIASASSLGFTAADFGRRRFRHPHHSASAVALIGGGSTPRPGEISLAHHGVLFLDELPEFDRRVLEALREPLENGVITISRAAQQVEFPARFQLVAAMNPSPQGEEVHSLAAQRYRARISGPLLDRIDIQLELPRVAAADLQPGGAAEPSSSEVRAQVAAARAVMLARQAKSNAALLPAELAAVAPLAPRDAALLHQAMDKLRLSARAHDRILKVARTIADFDGKAAIDTAALTEALGYRALDRLFSPS